MRNTLKPGQVDAAGNQGRNNDGVEIGAGNHGNSAANMQHDGGLILHSGSSVSYKHWNIFFKDIYKVLVEIFDRETNQKIDLKDLE